MDLPEPLNPKNHGFEPVNESITIKPSVIHVSSRGDIITLEGVICYETESGEIIEKRNIELKEGYIDMY